MDFSAPTTAIDQGTKAKAHKAYALVESLRSASFADRLHGERGGLRELPIEGGEMSAQAAFDAINPLMESVIECLKHHQQAAQKSPRMPHKPRAIGSLSMISENECCEVIAAYKALCGLVGEAKEYDFPPNLQSSARLRTL